MRITAILYILEIASLFDISFAIPLPFNLLRPRAKYAVVAVDGSSDSESPASAAPNADAAVVTTTALSIDLQLSTLLQPSTFTVHDPAQTHTVPEAVLTARNPSASSAAVAVVATTQHDFHPAPIKTETVVSAVLQPTPAALAANAHPATPNDPAKVVPSAKEVVDATVASLAVTTPPPQQAAHPNGLPSTEHKVKPDPPQPVPAVPEKQAVASAADHQQQSAMDHSHNDNPSVAIPAAQEKTPSIGEIAAPVKVSAAPAPASALPPAVPVPATVASAAEIAAAPAPASAVPLAPASAAAPVAGPGSKAPLAAPVPTSATILPLSISSETTPPFNDAIIPTPSMTSPFAISAPTPTPLVPSVPTSPKPAALVASPVVLPASPIDPSPTAHILSNWTTPMIPPSQTAKTFDDGRWHTSYPAWQPAATP